MSWAITDINLSNIQGIKIVPKFEDNIAGRSFAIMDAKDSSNKINGLFSMNALETRLKDLYKEATKGKADSKEKLSHLRNLKAYAKTLGNAEDLGIAAYDQMGCFFQLITTLFCRLFDLCAPSHKDYQAKLKGKIDTEINRLRADPNLATRDPAIDALIAVRDLDCEFTQKATKSIEMEYQGPLITWQEFNALLMRHDATLGSITSSHGRGVDNLKEAFSKGVQKFNPRTKAMQMKKLQTVMTIISQKDNSGDCSEQLQSLIELVTVFAGCQDGRDRAIRQLFKAFVAPTLGLQEQLHALIARTNEEALDAMIKANHPNCMTSSDPTEQFIHLKSHYLIHLAADLNLEGGEEAKEDVVVKGNMHTMALPKFVDELIAQHRAIFQAQIDPLCQEVANLLNEALRDTSSMAVTQTEVGNWMMAWSSRLPDGFGYYDENKEFFDCYEYTREPRQDQIDGINLYLSPDEIKFMLQFFEFIDGV